MLQILPDFHPYMFYFLYFFSSSNTDYLEAADVQLHVLDVKNDKLLVDLTQKTSDSLTSVRDALLYLGEGAILDGGQPTVSGVYIL